MRSNQGVNRNGINRQDTKDTKKKVEPFEKPAGYPTEVPKTVHLWASVELFKEFGCPQIIPLPLNSRAFLRGVLDPRLARPLAAGVWPQAAGLNKPPA